MSLSSFPGSTEWNLFSNTGLVLYNATQKYEFPKNEYLFIKDVENDHRLHFHMDQYVSLNLQKHVSALFGQFLLSAPSFDLLTYLVIRD